MSNSDNHATDKPDVTPVDSMEGEAMAENDVTVDEQHEDGASLLTGIGRQLREAREAQGKQLTDMVRELKLRKIYLEAMENGKWEILPDEVYAIGFLRQYAAHLKLDLDDDINKIKNRQYQLTRPLTFPDPPVAPSRRWAWVAAACFLVLFLAFNIFNHDIEAPAPTDPIPAVMPPASEPEAAVPETEASISTPDHANPPENTGPIESAQPVISLPAPVAAVPEQATPATDLHSYRFEAVGDAVWLQVYLPDASGSSKGELRKEALLNAGHHLMLNEPYDRLWLTTGNAGALEISIDEKIINAVGSLGDKGTVLRNYQLGIK